VSHSELSWHILQLYATTNLGVIWTLVYAMVNPRFYWYVPEHDADDPSIVHLEAEDPATGIYWLSSCFD